MQTAIARPDELTVEVFAPCVGSSVAKDGRATIPNPFGRIGAVSLPTVYPLIVLPMEIWEEAVLEEHRRQLREELLRRRAARDSGTKA